MDFRFVKPLFIFFNSVHECDVTPLDLRFAVMIVHYPFASSEMDPFVGGMDGENVLHVIVCDVVIVSHLCIRYNIC